MFCEEVFVDSVQLNTSENDIPQFTGDQAAKLKHNFNTKVRDTAKTHIADTFSEEHVSHVNTVTLQEQPRLLGAPFLPPPFSIWKVSLLLRGGLGTAGLRPQARALAGGVAPLSKNTSHLTINDNPLKYSLQLKVSELESQILKQSEVLERAQVQIVRWDFFFKEAKFYQPGPGPNSQKVF